MKYSSFLRKSPHLESKDKIDVQNVDCCSHSSSARESWGRCSSLGGGSGVSSPAESLGVSNSKQQESSTDSGHHQSTKKHHPSKAFRALASPLRRMNGKSGAKLKEKKKGMVPPKKKIPRVKLEKGDTLSQRLRLYFLGRGPNHKRHQSI